MTCIVGLRRNGRITIAGDSAGTDGRLVQTLRTDPKVFERTDDNGVRWIFGYCGSFRLGQLLRFSLRLPEVRMKPGAELEFMATRFLDAVRNCLKEGGFAERKHEQEFGGCFMVGVQGHLFTIYDDYQVATEACDFSAIGCADQVALGAMHIMVRLAVHDPGTLAHDADMVIDALKAAEAFSAGVRRPWVIISDPGSTTADAVTEALQPGAQQ